MQARATAQFSGSCGEAPLTSSGSTWIMSLRVASTTCVTCGQYLRSNVNMCLCFDIGSPLAFCGARINLEGARHAPSALVPAGFPLLAQPALQRFAALAHASFSALPHN